MVRQVVFTHGTVFTGTGDLLRDAAVLVADGRIAGVGPDLQRQPDAEVHDLGGKFIMAGFIDAHTHLALWSPVERDEFRIETPFWAVRAARQILASGVTTVRDVGGVNHFDLGLRDAIARGQVAGPRMLVAGRFIAPTGGHVHYWARRADGVDEVRKAVREQLEAGVDLIKLMVSGGAANVDENPDRIYMRPEEIEAAVSEASEAGKPVAAHVHPPKAIRICAELGVTSAEHAKGLDDETIATVLQHGMWVVPTQAAYKRLADNVDGYPDRLAAIAQKVFDEMVPTATAAIKAGVKIGVGTDCSRHYPHTAFLGELLALHNLGLTNEQLLLAATRGNAELLGLTKEIGTIEPGKRADLVVLEASPLDDLSNAGRVVLVVQGGQALRPDALLQVGRV